MRHTEESSIKNAAAALESLAGIYPEQSGASVSNPEF